MKHPSGVNAAALLSKRSLELRSLKIARLAEQHSRRNSKITTLTSAERAKLDKGESANEVETT